MGDKYLASARASSDLLMVHCTHGLNRTGYLICRYMIEKKGINPLVAITAFNTSRGHVIERENYLQDLKRRMKIDPNSGASGTSGTPNTSGTCGTADDSGASSGYHGNQITTVIRQRTDYNDRHPEAASGWMDGASGEHSGNRWRQRPYREQNPQHGQYPQRGRNPHPHPHDGQHPHRDQHPQRGRESSGVARSYREHRQHQSAMHTHSHPHPGREGSNWAYDEFRMRSGSSGSSSNHRGGSRRSSRDYPPEQESHPGGREDRSYSNSGSSGHAGSYRDRRPQPHRR